MAKRGFEAELSRITDSSFSLLTMPNCQGKENFSKVKGTVVPILLLAHIPTFKLFMVAGTPGLGAKNNVGLTE